MNETLFLVIVSLTVCLAMATSFAGGALISVAVFGVSLPTPVVSLPQDCDGVLSTDGRDVCIHPAPLSPVVYYGSMTLLPLPEVRDCAGKGTIR